MALPTPPRFDELELLIPRARMMQKSATVIGVGAVGRQVALQLVALGIPKLQLIDFATVELTNVTSQGFLSEDIGSTKVDAVGGLCHRAEPLLDLETICERFQPSHTVGTSVFCCVGSNADRAAIWDTARTRCRFWGDGRIVAESARIRIATDEEEHQRYRRSLTELGDFQPSSAPAAHVGALAAALLIDQFVRYLRELPLIVDASFDLATGRYLVNDESA